MVRCGMMRRGGWVGRWGARAACFIKSEKNCGELRWREYVRSSGEVVGWVDGGGGVQGLSACCDNQSKQD